MVSALHRAEGPWIRLAAVIVNNYKNKNNNKFNNKKQQQQQISAIDDLNQTKLKLGFWIKNNNKAKTMK